MSDGTTSDGRLVELSVEECWELVRGRPYGRLAWVGADGLNVVPVNHVVDDGRIVVRTAAYTAMARETREADVAFQVDDVDVATRSGWSVLVRGRCHEAEPEEDAPDPDVWAGGARHAVLVIEPREVVGRRLG